VSVLQAAPPQNGTLRIDVPDINKERSQEVVVELKLTGKQIDKLLKNEVEILQAENLLQKLDVRSSCRLSSTPSSSIAL